MQPFKPLASPCVKTTAFAAAASSVLGLFLGFPPAPLRDSRRRRLAAAPAKPSRPSPPRTRLAGPSPLEQGIASRRPSRPSRVPISPFRVFVRSVSRWLGADGCLGRFFWLLVLVAPPGCVARRGLGFCLLILGSVVLAGQVIFFFFGLSVITVLVHTRSERW